MTDVSHPAIFKRFKIDDVVMILFLCVVVSIAGWLTYMSGRRQYIYNYESSIINDYIDGCKKQKCSLEEWGFILSEWVELRNAFGYPVNMSPRLWQILIEAQKLNEKRAFKPVIIRRPEVK